MGSEMTDMEQQINQKLKTAYEIARAATDTEEGRKAIDFFYHAHLNSYPGFAYSLITSQRAISGDTSDGYHTFNELYEFRLLYNAAFFNELYKSPTIDAMNTFPVKSWKHSDGSDCFGGGWFVVTAQLPTGQITNHYEAKDWDLFQIPEVPTAPEWDGHTPQDVAKRLREFLAPKPPKEGE